MCKQLLNMAIEPVVYDIFAEMNKIFWGKIGRGWNRNCGRCDKCTSCLLTHADWREQQSDFHSIPSFSTCHFPYRSWSFVPIFFVELSFKILKNSIHSSCFFIFPKVPCCKWYLMNPNEISQLPNRTYWARWPTGPVGHYFCTVKIFMLYERT